MILRRFVSIAALVSTALHAVEATPSAHMVPKEIGSRTVVLDFTVGENAKPLSVDVVSSEAAGLDPWAKALILSGQMRPGSPGVTMIHDGKYRAVLAFPIEGDSAPLPPGITLPQASVQPGPQYPYELTRDGVPGGALLKLTIDEKAHVTKVELVRASHREFGKAALTAVKKWQFAQPAKQDGKPVAVTLFQLIKFGIEGNQMAPWQWQASPEPCLPEYSVTGAWIKITR